MAYLNALEKKVSDLLGGKGTSPFSAGKAGAGGLFLEL